MADQGADDPLESRVEDLFSSAVERQVQERKAVGRALEELGHLVKSLDERMARLEDRSNEPDDDEVTKAIVAALGNVDRRLTGLEDVGAQRDQELRGTLDSVTSSLSSLGGGASQREQEVSGALDGVLTRLQAIEDVSAQRDTDLRVALDTLAARLENVTQSVGDQVNAPVDQLGAQLDERLTRLEAADGARDREVRDQMAGVGEQVESLSARLRDVVAEAVEQMSRRQDEAQQSLERAVLSAASERGDLELLVDQVADRVVQSSPPVDTGVIAEALVGRLKQDQVRVHRDDIIEALKDGVPTAVQVASAVDASIRDALISVTDEVRDEIDRVRDEVFSVRHEVADGLSTVRPMTTSLGSEIESLQESLAALAREVARLDARQDEAREQLDDRFKDVGDVLEQQTARQADRLAEATDKQAEVLAEVTAKQADDLYEVRQQVASQTETLVEKLDAAIAELSSRVAESTEERLTSAVEQRLTAMEGMREELTGTIERMRSNVDRAAEKLGSLDGLQSLLDEQAARFDRLTDELPAAAATTFDQRAESLVADLRRTMDDIAESMRGDIAVVAEKAEDARQAQTDELANVGDKFDTIERHVRNLRERVKKGTTDLATQAKAMEAMTADVTGIAETMGVVFAEIQGQLQSDQEAAMSRLEVILREGEARIDTAGEVMTTQSDLAAEKLSEAVTAINSSSEGLREELRAVLDEMSSAARVDAEAARDEVIAAGARLDLLFDRLAGFERAVVDHLGARDQQFSRERALIVESLVEQLSGGLGKRERKRLSAKLEVPPAVSVASPPEAAVPAPRTPEPGDRDVEVDEKVLRARPRREEPDVVPKRQASSTKAGTKKATTKKAATKKAATKASAAASSRVTREDLAAVKGLGPAKVDALVDAFGSPGKVVKASADELAAVPGISERLAKAVVEQFG